MTDVDVIEQIGIEAGNKAEKLRTENLNVDRKKDETFVTEADKKVEAFIISELTEKFDFPVVGEEGAVELDLQNVSDYFVVDPIDGTQNYVYNQPLYGSSICLVKNQEPYIGVFYMPELEYCFTAELENGASLNNEPLSVSNQTELLETYCVTSGHNSSVTHSEIASMNRGWSQRFSCALQAEAWLSAGWLDYGVFGPIHPWDFGTGVLLVREAGGYVTHIKSNKTDWNNLMNGCLIMANSPELAETVQSHLSDETISKLCSGINTTH